jgi:hypothetical protein
MPKIQPRRKHKTLVGGHGSSASKKNNGNGLNHYKTKRQVKSQEQTQTDPATQPGFPMAKVKSQTQLKIKRGIMNGTHEIKIN